MGWKHSLVIPSDFIESLENDSFHKTYFITLTKNPYSWLLSLYNRPHHYRHTFNFFENPMLWLLSLYKSPANYTIKKKTFEDFLVSPWLTVDRENAPPKIVNPIMLWNIKNASYIDLKNNAHAINLKYEDLLISPEKLICDISNVFHLTKKDEKFKNLHGSTKGDKKHFSDYQLYYLEERWKEKLSQKAINIINSYLDNSLLEYYGYRKLP